MRRIAALLLGLVLLLSIPLAACADGESEAVVIATTEDFLRFAAACAEESYSADKRFVLTADIDLSNTDFAPVPYFAGAFDGGGH